MSDRNNSMLIPDSVDLTRVPRESIFASHAQQLVRLGWSVYPQEQDSRRSPGKVYGHMIKWSTVHNLQDSLPDEESLRLWAAHCGTLNTACAMGAGSRNVFALDIDVTDEAMSMDIADIAEEMLGATPFSRIGQEPKIALLYRYDPTDEIHNATFTIDGEKKYAIEVLGRGKSLTLFGRHHRTGRYFRWLGESALQLGPQSAPVVSSEMMQRFLSAVSERYPFQSASGSGRSLCSGLNVPSVATGADGKITDGREAWLRDQAFSFVLDAQREIADTMSNGPDALHELRVRITQDVIDDFVERASCEGSGGRWSGESLKHEAFKKVSSAMRKIMEEENNGAAPKRSSVPVINRRPRLHVVAGTEARRGSGMTDDEPFGGEQVFADGNTQRKRPAEEETTPAPDYESGAHRRNLPRIELRPGWLEEAVNQADAALSTKGALYCFGRLVSRVNEGRIDPRTGKTIARQSR